MFSLCSWMYVIVKMASPRIVTSVLKNLSPRSPRSVENLRQSLTPKTPVRKDLRVENHGISRTVDRNHLSPFNIDTPNRVKILNNGLQNVQRSLLGTGSFGRVYKASYKGNEVAAKIINRRKDSDLSVNAEKHATYLNHSNIVKVLGIDQGTSLSLITMELCGTSLQDLLDDSTLEKEERIRIWKAISCALDFCHRAGVVHADVKPKNILMAADGQPKLADFGSSVLMDELDFSSRKHGTPGYAAPEVIQGDFPSPASDIYSLGVLAWQMLSQKIPFAGFHAHTILYLTGKGKRPIDDNLDDGFNGTYKKLYRDMWSQDMKKRPMLRVIINKLSNMELRIVGIR
ncbi:serine/threonine-protein kinase mos isoform X2 [Cephus cinctus]|uniref:non-specific serine/threonine protein kinase n=1 Tax=Cephus cinctus TaxID=211228 RepID=A0AAJ7FD42_CEPCN|nr:serine/threonine-protein kinase mos isoform X2 [Cephus cinctus]